MLRLRQIIGSTIPVQIRGASLVFRLSQLIELASISSFWMLSFDKSLFSFKLMS